MIDAIKAEITEWLRSLAFAVPGKAGQLLRILWCRSFLRSWGASSRAASGTIFEGPDSIEFGAACSVGTDCFFSAHRGKIIIGDNVKFNRNVHINASVSGTISIADNCLIGPNVMMRSADHNFNDPDKLISEQGHIAEDITIEEDVWLAGNVVILKGVTVARGCVIGAGSVVTKSTEPMCLYAGVPAKLIKRRGE